MIRSVLTTLQKANRAVKAQKIQQAIAYRCHQEFSAGSRDNPATAMTALITAHRTAEKTNEMSRLNPPTFLASCRIQR